jgi:hypothetical protein
MRHDERSRLDVSLCSVQLFDLFGRLVYCRVLSQTDLDLILRDISKVSGLDCNDK